MKKSHTWAAGLLGLALLSGAGCRTAGEPTGNNNTAPAPPSGTVVAITDEDIKPTPAPNKFNIGIVVAAGTIGYRVDEMSWRDKLPDGATPAAGKKFLFLNLSLANTGPKDSPLARFNLVDGKTEYPLSNKGLQVPDSLHGVTQLAKDERKKGVLVFEAPEGKKLKLKIASAPPVKDEMFVELFKATPPPTKAASTPPDKKPGATEEKPVR